MHTFIEEETDMDKGRTCKETGYRQYSGLRIELATLDL